MEVNVDCATPEDLPATTKRKVSDVLSREEIRAFNQRSDVMGFVAVGFTWAVIVAALALLAWARTQAWWVAAPLLVVGMIALGGRHLALAILHHEAAHKSLFKTLWLNEWVGDYLCARPTWNDLRKYRAHHFIHHRRTNQPDDTDVSLIEGFPTTRASLRRKLLRDVLGVTGLKALLGRLLMDLELIQWTVANNVTWLSREGRTWRSYPRALLKNAWSTLLTNAALALVCWSAGHTWLYGSWVLSYITPFPLFLRIRSMAEHACTDRGTDMFLNTRTVRAGFLARATVAPIRVNFHIEHHVLPSVPYFQLPALHRLLRERGAVDALPSYQEVLRIVSSAPAPTRKGKKQHPGC